MFPNRRVFSDKLIELLSEELFTGYLLTVWDSLFFKANTESSISVLGDMI